LPDGKGVVFFGGDWGMGLRGELGWGGAGWVGAGVRVDGSGWGRVCLNSFMAFSSLLIFWRLAKRF
jgi:hypothetical protein